MFVCVRPMKGAGAQLKYVCLSHMYGRPKCTAQGAELYRLVLKSESFVIFNMLYNRYRFRVLNGKNSCFVSVHSKIITVLDAV